MAKQAGIMRLTGPLGDFSFYEMKGEFYVRRQTHHAVDIDPRFKKTHLMGLDFGTATRASKLLRAALGPAMRPFFDEHIASRLTGRFVKVVHADTTHVIGRRKVLTSNLHLLQGFEFNRDRAFEPRGLSTAVSLDRATGQIRLSVSTSSRKLANTQLVAAIACVNFEKDTYARQDPVTFTIGETKTRELVLSVPNTDPHAVVIVTLGISSTSPAALSAVAVSAKVEAGLQQRMGAMAIIAALPVEAGRQLKGEHQPPIPARPDHSVKRSCYIPRSHNRPSHRYLDIDRGLRRQTFPRPREFRSST